MSELVKLSSPVPPPLTRFGFVLRFNYDFLEQKVLSCIIIPPTKNEHFSYTM